MKTNKLISTIIIVIIAVLMVTIVLGLVQAVDAAPKKVKVTWNANGGKIGATKTTVTSVKKGAKIGKLPKTPTKVGYTFKGWYTKKTGGTKITKTSKVKKKVTYYAQWKKNTNINTNSKLVGNWEKLSYYYEWDPISKSYYSSPTSEWLYYTFLTNGRFSYIETSGWKFEGKYSVSNGKIYFTEVKRIHSDGFSQKYNNMDTDYKLGSDKEGNYLQITTIRDGGHYTLSSADKFYVRK